MCFVGGALKLHVAILLAKAARSASIRNVFVRRISFYMIVTVVVFRRQFLVRSEFYYA